jgi:hypothetical protein
VRPAGSYKPTPVASAANLVLALSARLPVLVQSAHSLRSLPPLSGGFASQGPASAAGAFLWCRCSNAALRSSSSWFLREVVFELLLFLRASSAPLCVVVACTCTLVLMRVASSPPPLLVPTRESKPRHCIRRCSAVDAGGQWVHITSVLCCRTGCAPSAPLLPFVAVV